MEKKIPKYLQPEPEQICKTCLHWGIEIEGENRRSCHSINVNQKTDTNGVNFSPDFGCIFHKVLVPPITSTIKVSSMMGGLHNK